MSLINKSAFLGLTALMALPALSTNADVFMTDQGHTEVRFAWSHAGVSMQSAEFESVSGMLDLNEGDVSKSKLDVTIDANSINTGFGIFNDHIKAAAYFDVENHPEITFTSTGIKSTGEKTADIMGELTIKGVTKPVTLNATLTHLGDHPLGKIIDYYKGKWAGFAAETTIDHMEFGVGQFSTGPITISISTEMKQK